MASFLTALIVVLKLYFVELMLLAVIESSFGGSFLVMVAEGS